MSYRDGINYLTDDDQINAYADMLNDVYGTVTVAGMEFDTAYALKELDPTAYRCGQSDYFGNGDYVEIEFDGETVLINVDDENEWDELDESDIADEDES